MSEEIKTGQAPLAAPAATTDLSQAIEGSIEREPGEDVTRIRVFDGNYRFNWWVRDAAPGPVYLNNGRIIKSKFLHATIRGEKFVVED